MGMWGNAAWDNDDAADWYFNLFDKTKLAKHVEKALKEKDVEEYAGKIRAAAYVLVCLGHVYVWPVDKLENHLKLAISKLEEILELDDYAGEKSIAKELKELRKRLKQLAPDDDEEEE